MAAVNEITNALNALLQPETFGDYGPNALQLPGRAEVLGLERRFIDTPSPA